MKMYLETYDAINHQIQRASHNKRNHGYILNILEFRVLDAPEAGKKAWDLRLTAISSIYIYFSRMLMHDSQKCVVTAA